MTSPPLLAFPRGDDDETFRSVIEPHRLALHAHCYRMLGSLHDADDALQNTLLRAWRALPKFRGRSSARTWLYRIATNVCLDVIAGRRNRVVPFDLGPATTPGVAHPRSLAIASWIEPYPVDTRAGAAGDAAPEACYERREALELACVAALRDLPARQRSALVLRDVLGFTAKEAADALATTVASVNAALLRARRAVDERLPDESRQPSLGVLGDRRLRQSAERFADALERGEIDAILTLLSKDAPSALPPDRDRPRGERVPGQARIGIRSQAAQEKPCGYPPTPVSSAA
jgi:RNA polymerase sigma-70 factor, ECF subfamily